MPNLTTKEIDIKTMLKLCGFFFAMLHGTQDLSSQTEIEPMSPAVEGQGLNHWITKEVPEIRFCTNYI